MLCLVQPASAESTESANLKERATVIRIMTVVICQQDGFLSYVLEPYLRDKNLTIEYSKGHNREVARAAQNSQADIVMAHTKVKPMQKLAGRGVISDGMVLFANAKVFLGPQGDPAGIAGLRDGNAAMEQIQNAGYCFLVNPHGGLEKLQRAMIKQARPDKHCILEGASDTVNALDMANAQNAYTLWALHPYADRGQGRLQPVVIPDQRLVADMGIWLVADSPVAEQARDILAYLAGDDANARITAFRLKAYPEVRPWWPATTR